MSSSTSRISTVPNNLNTQRQLHASDLLNSPDNHDLSAISERDAHMLLDELWKALDSPVLTTDINLRSIHYRNKLREISKELSIIHNMIPSSFFLKDVQYTDRKAARRGSINDVFAGTFQGTKVALKRLRTGDQQRNDELKQLLYRELLSWKNLSHKHLVPVIGVSAKRSSARDTIYMVIPWMENGSLRDYIASQRREDLLVGNDQIEALNRWLYQILDGLTYLHSEGVVHGNLHGGNVLVDEIGNACLTDFGQASLVEMVNNLQAVESSRAEHLRWTAPELIKVSGNATVAPGRRTGTREGDVFSFACICVELYSGKPPMSELTGVQAGRRYVGGKRPARPFLLDGDDLSSDALWSLVISCWVQRPSVRPSAEAARNQMGVIGNILGRMLDETQLQLNDAKAELNDTKVELNAAKHEWATKEKIYTGQIVDLESKVAALSKSLEAEIISHPNLPLQKRHTDLTREFEMYRLSMRGLGEQVQKSMQEQTAQNAQRWDALRVSMQEQAVQDVQRWDALRLNFQAQLNSFQKDDVGKTKEQHSASS